MKVVGVALLVGLSLVLTQPAWSHVTDPAAASTAETKPMTTRQLFMSERPLVPPWATLAGTIILGAAAVAQAIFAYWTVRAETHARKSAEAASAALGLARRTSELQLRAYVGLESAKFIKFDEKQILVEMEFINAGATPAQNIRMRMDIWGGESAMRDDIVSITESRLVDHEFAGSLLPGRISTVPLVLNGAKDHHFARFAAGELFIFAAVELRYVDIFGTPQKTRAIVWSEERPGPEVRLHLTAKGQIDT